MYYYVGNYNPFYIGEKQERIFRAAAIAPPGGPHYVMINVSGACPDCQHFQYKMRDILNSLPGWHAGVGQMFAAADTISGIIIYMPAKQTPAAATVLARAFQAAGIDFKTKRVNRDLGVTSKFVEIPEYEVEINTGPL